MKCKYYHYIEATNIIRINKNYTHNEIKLLVKQYKSRIKSLMPFRKRENQKSKWDKYIDKRIKENGMLAREEQYKKSEISIIRRELDAYAILTHDPEIVKMHMFMEKLEKYLYGKIEYKESSYRNQNTNQDDMTIFSTPTIPRINRQFEIQTDWAQPHWTQRFGRIERLQAAEMLEVAPPPFQEFDEPF